MTVDATSQKEPARERTARRTSGTATARSNSRSSVAPRASAAIDISKLRAQTGVVTLDYGFMNTGSCESSITFIDGEAGILRYRGIPIEQLVDGPGRPRSSRRRTS